MLLHLSARYLNCTPEQFQGSALTFSGGSDKEWNEIGDLLNWLNHSVLTQFKSLRNKMSLLIESIRSGNSQYIGEPICCPSDYYGDLPR